MQIIDDILRDVFEPHRSLAMVGRARLREILTKHLVPHRHIDSAEPLIVYFETDADRQEFIDAVQEVKPGMKAIKV